MICSFADNWGQQRNFHLCSGSKPVFTEIGRRFSISLNKGEVKIEIGPCFTAGSVPEHSVG